MNAKERMELYERQLNFVESILAFHPEFLEAFSAADLRLFRAYFLPDWNEHDDFREYHAKLTRENPGIEAEATALLSQLIRAHGVDHTNLLS